MATRKTPPVGDRGGLEAVPDLADARAAKAVPPPRVFASIEAAVTGGATEREVLVTVRTRLAKMLDDVNLSARDLASNSRRLLEVDRSIRAIDAAAGGVGDGIGAATGTDDAPFDPGTV